MINNGRIWRPILTTHGNPHYTRSLYMALCHDMTGYDHDMTGYDHDNHQVPQIGQKCVRALGGAPRGRTEAPPGSREEPGTKVQLELRGCSVVQWGAP